MHRKARMAAAILFFLTTIALGQDGHFDVSVNGAGVFTKESNGNGIAQSATNGANFFGTFRVKFKAKHSLLFNYGRAKNTQIHQSSSAFDFHILAKATEYTGAYAYTPFQKGRFAPFVLAGAGALIFSPRDTVLVVADVSNNVISRFETSIGAAKQTEIAFLYGVGVDYRLPVFSRLSLRLQYRGLFYNAPDFKVDASSGNSLSLSTGARGHMAEPSIGLVFRF